MQLLWKGLMAYVARFDIDLMFGCASLAGTDPDALALPLSYLHHFHPMPENLRVRARPELFVDMNRMPQDAIDAARRPAQPAAAAERLCAGRLLHRRRRGDRPPVRHHRRLHLFPAVGHRRALQVPLRAW